MVVVESGALARKRMARSPTVKQNSDSRTKKHTLKSVSGNLSIDQTEYGEKMDHLSKKMLPTRLGWSRQAEKEEAGRTDRHIARGWLLKRQAKKKEKGRGVVGKGTSRTGTKSRMVMGAP